MAEQRSFTPRSARTLSRRRFVQGLVASGVLAGLDLMRRPALARGAARAQEVLTGSRFALTIAQIPVNITGYHTRAVAMNGSIPGPLLRWREGDTVTVAVTNRLSEDTSIHWHGIRTPANMDGVPSLSFPGIAPNETFVYRFLVPQSGTYWYHSHSHFQEQTGHYGPLVIDSIGKDPVAFDREYVVMLSDWTDEDPKTIFSNLKQQSSYYNFHQRTVGTFVSDVQKHGLGPTLADRWMWNKMNMSPTDILDVSGATYTYLLNGQPPAANWTGLFRPGERVRLRFINAAAMTIFDVRIPHLPMTVVQADGNNVEPVTVDEFRISVAETYDVIVQPREAAAYTVFAQAEDRTGYARGTLAPRLGMAAAVPPMDPRPLRTMVDMGMAHTSGAHGSHSPEMNKEQPGAQGGATPEHGMSGAGKGDIAGGHTGHPPGTQMGTEGTTPAGSHTGADISGPEEGKKHLPRSVPEDLHLSPAVDNIAEMPTNRLSTAGEGFPPGRRVLAYADLRALHRGTDPRPPSREIELHLTGNMERFLWTFDGEKFSDAEPIRLTLGERVRIILVNDSMMEHPIHLHGLWSELENGHDELRPYKHTINVKPGERLSYLVPCLTSSLAVYSRQRCPSGGEYARAPVCHSVKCRRTTGISSLATGGENAATDGATCDSSPARARGAVQSGDRGPSGHVAEFSAEVAQTVCPVRAVAADERGRSRSGSAPRGTPGFAPVGSPAGFFPRWRGTRSSPSRAKALRNGSLGAFRTTVSGIWPVWWPGAARF